MHLASSRAIRAAGLGLALAAVVVVARADSVQLKNGIIYRGVVDKDKPLLWVYDGIKRVALRDSKVEKIVSDASFQNLEKFDIEQPLVVHGGAMPKEVLSVKAGPWNDRGRRTFAYEGSKAGKVLRMEQAINVLTPHLARIRGVDGFWLSQVSTSQIPREVVLGILAKVDRRDKNERIRVARFLIQAGWYAEARAELARILNDFKDDADLRERVSLASASVGSLDAARVRSDIDRLRASRQPREASNLLKTFPTRDVAPDLEAQVRELQRLDDSQAAADKALADELAALAARIAPKKTEAPKDEPKSKKKADATPATAPEWREPLKEVLKALHEAPDAVRERFVAWQKAKSEGGKADPALFALAMSGFVVGADAAVEEIETARLLWTVRDQVRSYLKASSEAERRDLLEKLEAAALPALKEQSFAIRKLDTVTRLAQRMPPPLHDDDARGLAKSVKTYRVRDDENAEPTEYAVYLPPEYHPLRSYPAVVALHDGEGPQAAIAWWSAEAARRGYIVVAPSYLPAQAKEYHYTEAEHAAVELALRDARRRFAIDSDRVFVGGQLVGANAAWDVGLAHPDLFAGVVVISGLPFKYVNRYVMHNAKDLPLYVALGDLAPASNEFVYGEVLKPMIAKAWDVTYVEYLRRGLEDLPEEAPAVFEWMDRRRRSPYPKSFEVDTARPSDSRFFGVVARELRPGRFTAPEAVDGFGKNLHPATIKLDTSRLSNLLRVQTGGVSQLDVWVSPALIDFTKKLEVRVNNRSLKGQPKTELAPLLEDLRIRGDRQQVYWMKVSVNVG
jgi:hypothetical protein